MEASLPPSRFLRTSRGQGMPGTAHATKTSFRLNERAFKRDDIPPHALEAKKKVMTFKMGDVICGGGRPSWKTCALPDHKRNNEVYEKERSMYLRSFGGTLNTEHVVETRSRPSRFAGSLAKPIPVATTPAARARAASRTKRNVPRTAEDRPEWGAGWNPDMSIDRRQLLRTSVEQGEKAQMSRHRRLTQIKDKYVPPIERERIFLEAMRKRKLEDRDPLVVAAREKEEEKQRNMLIQEEKRKHRQIWQQIMTQSKHRADTRTYSYYHDGTWQSGAWSCCMNETQDSRGCCCKTRNPDRWNLASI